MQTATTLRELRMTLLAWREAGESVAFVPTMGALHQGHMALIEAARKMAKRTVVSIFLNPTQFSPREDLSTYPHQPELDIELLTKAGCDCLYKPEASEMYPDGFVTKIDPGPMAALLEGVYRPHFFFGVAIIVTKLLLQIMPDIAFFGEKDYQQLLIIRRIVRDLDIPIHIAAVPTIRDSDGLALSSRNAYLSSDERLRAVVLPRTLSDTLTKIKQGGDMGIILEAGCQQLISAGFKVDYLECVDAQTLIPLRSLKTPARLLAAARIGTTRLIDNMAVDTAQELK